MPNSIHQKPIHSNQNRTLSDPRLIQRGIARQADDMAWQCTSTRWEYPVYDFDGQVVTYRTKAYNRDAEYKYTWKPNKNGAKYYHHPEIRQYIADSGGVLYIANGEPSVLAYHASGIYNVLCWFGEKSIPDTLIEDMNELGVRSIIYAPDHDKSGRESAIKLRDLLHSTDIRLTALDISAHVEDKGDTNDIWIDSHFMPDFFIDTLNDCQNLYLPPYKAHTPTPEYKHDTVDNSDAIQQLAIALGVSGWAINADNWTKKNICNPLRDDKHPSAGFNLLSGVLHDFATGDDHSPKELCAKYSIAWKAQGERKDLTSGQNDPKLERTSEIIADDSQIPNSLRSLAIKYGNPSEAVLIEYINKAVNQNLLNSDNFTVKEAVKALYSLGCKLSVSTIRQTLQSKTNVVCQILDTKEQPLVSNSRQGENNSETVPNSDNKNGHGAKSPLVSNFRQLPQNEVIERLLLRAKYRLYEKEFGQSEVLSIFTQSMLNAVNLDNETLIELNTVLESVYLAQVDDHSQQMAKIKVKYTKLKFSLEDKYSTPLPPNWTLTKPSQYKALFLRAIVEDTDDDYSRKELCETVGISNSSLSATFKNAGIENRYKELRIPVKTADSALLIAKEERAYIKWIAITDSEDKGTTYKPFNLDTAEMTIKTAVGQGYNVQAVLQPPAQQHIVTDSQPQPVQKQPSNTIRVPKQPSNARKAGYHHEASYDPQFVYWELAKAIKIVKGYTFRGDALHEDSTSEIFAVNPTARELVDILLDRVPVEFEETEMTDDGWTDYASDFDGVLDTEPRTHQEQLFPNMHTVNI
jgi:hypothetical protein